MSNKRHPDKVPVHLFVHRDLKAAVKKGTAKNGETLTDVVERAFQDYAAENEAKP